MSTRVLLLVCFALAASIALWWFVRAPKEAREDAAAVGAPRSDERSIAPSELGAPAVTAELVRAPVTAGDIAAVDEYRLRGRVVHEDGTAASHALVEIHVVRDEDVHDFELVASLAADADGRFEFVQSRDDFPVVITAEEHDDPSRAAGAGFIQLGAPPMDEVVVVLDELREAETMPEMTPVEVTGVVLFPDGSPADGALVFVTGPDRSAPTDATGRFALRLELTAHEVTGIPRSSIFARHVDGGLARDAEFGARLLAALPNAPWPTTLVLPGDAGRIVGRLVDPDGPPPAGWGISIQDPTGTMHARFAEPLSARTDGEGHFALKELDPGRTYRLAITAPDGAGGFVTAPIAPGPEPIDIEVGDAAFATDVCGQAISLSGEPLAGLTLQLVVDVLRHSGDGVSVSATTAGPMSRTDSDGGFCFARVPRVGTEVVAIDTPDQPMGGLRAWLDPGAKSRVLRFDRLVPLLTVAAAGEGATLQVRALDEEGRELVLHLFESGRRRYSAPAMAPGSELWVSESARTLVLEEWTFGPDEGPTIVERSRASIGHWAGPATGPIRVDFGGE